MFRQIKGGLFPYSVASTGFWSQTESKHCSCRPKDQTKYAAYSIFCFCKPNNYSHHGGDGYFGRSYKSPSLASHFLFVSTSKHGHLEGWEQTERLFRWATPSFCILCFVHASDFFTATHVTLNNSTLPHPCWYQPAASKLVAIAVTLLHWTREKNRMSEILMGCVFYAGLKHFYYSL